MAKRLTGTDKWDKAWFRKLEPKYKCFWEYIRDKCDLVGLWEIDFESASFHIGDKINEVDVLKIFDTRLTKIEDKILIMDFCHFQYGEVLNLKSPIHKKIKDILDKHTLYDTLYNRVVNTLQVKEEVIVKEEVEEDVIEKKENNIPDFSEFLDYANTKALDVDYELDETLVKLKYEYWKENGWKTGGDKPRKIKNWKTTVINSLRYMKKEKEKLALKEKGKAEELLESYEYVKRQIELEHGQSTGNN